MRRSLLLLLAFYVGIGSGFAGTFNAFGPKTHPRETGDPVTVVDQFSVLNPSAQYTLRIHNGGLVDGEFEKVSSSVIKLNGVQIVGPDEFNQNVSFLEKPVSLLANNELSVEVRGKPGGAIILEIVGVDSDPPTINATASPTPNAAGWNNTDVTVNFDCSDATSAIASCPPAQTVTTEGANQIISGTATDNAGNTATASVTLNVDKTPPTVVINSPADGATVTSSPATIAGTIGEALSGVEIVTCNGSGALLSNSVFSCNVALLAGANPITVQARDRAGNTGSASITVILADDTVPPSLSILTPAPGSFVFLNRPTIEVAYSDDSGVDTSTLAFSANGAAIAADCQLSETGGQCAPASALPEGAVTLEASISDLAGNPGSAQVQFTVDTLPVEVAIAAPGDGLITKDAEVQVSGTVGADVISVQVNGVAAPLAGTSFTATVPLREGINMLVALATKANGKTGTASVDVTRDIVAPVVRIDSPRDGFVSVTNVVSVTGLVNDIVNGGKNPLVKVNGVEATVAGGAFMAMDLRLVRGPNTIEAVATDAVGNEGRHQITVHFQAPIGGRLSVQSGNGQAGVVGQPLAQPLALLVKDVFDNPVAGRPVTFEVTRNSGALRVSDGDVPQRVLQVATDGTGLATVRLTLGDTAGEGNNRVRATALGVAGEVEFCASALAAAPDKILMVQGDNQRGVIGHPLASPLEALLVDKDGNPIAGVDVTFAVVQGNGSLDGQQSLVQVTGTDGIARAVLTLGPEPGINNNVVSASFQDLQGLPATFVASGLLPGNPAATRFSGVVLDNGHTPIPGAVVSIPGTTVSAVTDAEGQFLLENVPVGHIHLRIDPTNSPRSETFPPLEFETVTVAGQINVLGQPILLPPLDTEGSKIVGGASDVKLTMNGVAGLELTVFANSVTCPEGTPDRSPDGKQCRVSISQVHLDKVPMPPPSGTIFMPPAWTIQPAGVQFNPPARICIPNDGLPPGRVIDIFQFDHALNQFINVGKGTVSQDGFIICVDPGFGITAAGWGGCGQPQPPTTEGEKCGPCKTPVGSSCIPNPLKTGTACDDKNECTINDKCNLIGQCKGDAVTVDQITGACVVPVNGSATYTATSNAPDRIQWTAPSGNPSSAKGLSITVQYTTEGDKGITAACGPKSKTKVVAVAPACSSIIPQHRPQETPASPGSDFGRVGFDLNFTARYKPCVDNFKWCFRLEELETRHTFGTSNQGRPPVAGANDAAITPSSCVAVIQDFTPSAALAVQGVPTAPYSQFVPPSIVEAHERFHISDFRDKVQIPTMNDLAAFVANAANCSDCKRPTPDASFNQQLRQFTSTHLPVFANGQEEARAYQVENSLLASLVSAIRQRARSAPASEGWPNACK